MILRALYFVLLAVLALGVIGIQLDRQTYRDPQLAGVVPGPFRGVAQQRLLELAAAQDSVVASRSDAQELVRKRPLPARHLLLFAQAAEAAGERDAALAALEVAAARGWREPGPQLAVAQAGLLSGDYASAAPRLAALVATGGAPDQTNALLAAMMAEEAGRAALADQLTDEGTWKSYFVQRLRVADPEGEGFAATIAMAWDRGASLDCSQIRPVAEAYIREGRAEEAARIWRGECASQPLAGA